MTGVAVGQTAPPFRLPSAQGPEVALEDYRGKKNVVVWFTKGMACVFCRQHMSQLARIYPELAKRDTEVLQVTPSTPERARFYAAKYRLPFPYLCDADDTVRRAWRLEVRRRGPLWYMGKMIAGIRLPKPENDFGQEPPAFGEMARLLRDEDMGFFLVDRTGVIRYAYGGAYIDAEGGRVQIRSLPSNEEILRELDRCA